MTAARASTRGSRVRAKKVGDGPELEIVEDDHDDLTAPELTDVGNADRFARANRRWLRFCHALDRWLWFDGTRWRPDESSRVVAAAKALAKDVCRFALEHDDEALMKHGMRSQSASRVRAMIELARPDLAVSLSKLDRDPDVLNVLNGTIDLRTGELREHRREDMLTKLAPVTYDPRAEAPTWDAFLDRIFDGDEELVAFVQRAVGYSLTGLTDEQVLFLLHGSGANGKSTMLEALRHMVGDYGANASADMLLAKRDGHGVGNDVARLRGSRFVTASETGRGRRLDEERVKSLTGGDVVTARYLYAEHFEFRPQFKLWLATNAKPDVRDGSLAMWRRILLIPFAITIPEGERDHQLGTKLRDEAAGILRWAVEGAVQWRRTGLRPPEAVVAATTEYQSDQDLVARFIDDECDTDDPEATAAAGDLFKAFKSWCRDQGEEPMTQRAFGGELTRLGYEPHRTGRQRLRRGLRLSSLDDALGGDRW